MKITVAKLSDGKLSVYLDGKEVYLLPRKYEMTSDYLEKAFNEVVKQRYDPADLEW